MVKILNRGQIEHIKIEDITFDPDQPRQRIFDEDIKEIAINMKKVGIINPIEIDNDNVIVTGERRYRAAKMAGFKKIPCIRHDIQGDERFMHQVSENIHHNTMAPIDTYRSVKRLLKINNLLESNGKAVEGKAAHWIRENLGLISSHVKPLITLINCGENSDALKILEDNHNLTIRASIALAGLEKPFRDEILESETSALQSRAESIRAGFNRHPEATDDQKREFVKEILKEEHSSTNIQAQGRAIAKSIFGEKDSDRDAVENYLRGGLDLMDQVNKLKDRLNREGCKNVSQGNEPLVNLSLKQLRKAIDEILKANNSIIDG